MLRSEQKICKNKVTLNQIHYQVSRVYKTHVENGKSTGKSLSFVHSYFSKLTL